MTDISSRLQKVQEGCSRGERSEGKQAQALGTAGGRNAGDQAGLRSVTGTGDTGTEEIGTEDTGNRELHKKDNGASTKQPVISKSHANHERLRD